MSQKNYNFKFNPPEPTSEQISQHKDFGALLAQFEAAAPQEVSPLRVVSRNTNRWRRPLMYAAGLAAAAMLALVVFFTLPTVSIENQVAERMMAQPYINPMMQKLEKQYQTFTLDGSEGGVFEYESGSKVTVPANAFIDAAGEIVTGKVELRYKEYHDFVDFFIAGIPMQYDSAGKAHQLVSAGMIDIQAFQNGNPVQLKNDKILDIELVSMIDYNPNHNYNVYLLENEKRNWTYKGWDDIQPIGTNVNSDNSNNENAKVTAIKKEQAEELAKIEKSIPMPAEPLKPQPSNPDNFVTNFEFDDLDKTDPRIAELSKKYGNLLWEVSKDQAEQFNIATNENASWDDVQLEKINDRVFKVTLISGIPNGKNLTLTVKPVLAGVDYQKAMQDYQTKIEQYNQALQSRENQLKAQKEALNQRIEAELAAVQNGNATDAKKGNTKQKIINRFQVNSLGIWNCARPVLPSDMSVSAKFQTKSNQPLKFMNAYLANDEQNTVTHFLTTGNESITLNVENKTDNIMWVVDREGNLKVIYPNTFKDIEDNTKSYTFKFEEVNKSIESEADLRKVLEFQD